jgi:hypothetical protein
MAIPKPETDTSQPRCGGQSIRKPAEDRAPAENSVQVPTLPYLFPPAQSLRLIPSIPGQFEPPCAARRGPSLRQTEDRFHP